MQYCETRPFQKTCVLQHCIYAHITNLLSIFGLCLSVPIVCSVCQNWSRAHASHTHMLEIELRCFLRVFIGSVGLRQPQLFLRISRRSLREIRRGISISHRQCRSEHHLYITELCAIRPVTGCMSSTNSLHFCDNYSTSLLGYLPRIVLPCICPAAHARTKSIDRLCGAGRRCTRPILRGQRPPTNTTASRLPRCVV